MSELSSDPFVLAVGGSPAIGELATMLMSEGFKVVAVADGIAALELLSERTPSTVISDTNLPTLDGYKLCKFLKRNPGTKKVAVILLSDKDSFFDRMRGKMAGCDDFVAKSYEDYDVLVKVKHSQYQ